MGRVDGMVLIVSFSLLFPQGTETQAWFDLVSPAIDSVAQRYLA